VTNIYVGNLSFRATEDDVRRAFEAHGEVASVSIIMDRETGRSRGFAFVEMPNASEAAAAIEAVNGQEIAGRGVSANEAKPRTDRPPRSGGGGGGGRYGDDRGGGRYGGDRGGSGGGSGGGGGGRYGEDRARRSPPRDDY
jgi:RNA recognition motif-containing protein